MNPFDFEKRKHSIWRIDRETRANGELDKLHKKEYMQINSINLDLNETIYRICKYDHFINDLKNKTLTLVRPKLWDDPFENFLLNSIGVLESGVEVNLENISNSYYSLCWSLREESDGLWRNYKGTEDFAIKIKSTTHKLFNEIYNIEDNFHTLNYFIGKVEYVNDKQIIDFFNDKVDILNFQSGVEFAQTILTKRKAFDYEEEIRVIVKNGKNRGDLLSINCEWDNMVDEIIFDPWICVDKFDNIKSEIIKLGFKGKITRSKLYEKINFKVKM